MCMVDTKYRVQAHNVISESFAVKSKEFLVTSNFYCCSGENSKDDAK